MSSSYDKFEPVEADSDTDRSVEKKYEEIKDKRASSNHRQGAISSSGPSNDISSHIAIGSINETIQRANVICPTCRGTGTIQTDDGTLVALIPVKDKRLKPKRIKLKVSLSIFITLIICGITVFFLCPRSPTLELLSVTSQNISFSTKQNPFIVIKGQYRVKNENFVSVKLTSLSVEVMWYDYQVGWQPMKNFLTTTVNIRSSKTFIIFVNTTYSEPHCKEILRQWCSWDNSNIWIQITTEVDTSFLFHSEQVSSNDMKRISCHYNSTAS